MTPHSLFDQRSADPAIKAASSPRSSTRLALGALGPGWAPWMKLSLIPSDHRETGETAPVAVVYKVHRGRERSTFLRRMPDGTVARANSYEPLFGELLHEKHQMKTMKVRSHHVPAGRYELC